MACHDLCTLRKPPPKLRHLLGLGLNYCLQPSKPTKLGVLEDSLTRFQRDIYVKFFFGDRPSDWNPKQLYLKTDWEPDPDDLPPEFRARISEFKRHMRNSFSNRRRGHKNLLPYQQYLLNHLRKSNDFIIIPSDKNLGPVVLERETYLRRAHSDHLSDSTTYRHLSSTEAAADRHFCVY
jgi:hypothetical protein